MQYFHDQNDVQNDFKAVFQNDVVTVSYHSIATPITIKQQN